MANGFSLYQADPVAQRRATDTQGRTQVELDKLLTGSDEEANFMEAHRATLEQIRDLYTSISQSLGVEHLSTLSRVDNSVVASGLLKSLLMDYQDLVNQFEAATVDKKTWLGRKKTPVVDAYSVAKSQMAELKSHVFGARSTLRGLLKAKGSTVKVIPVGTTLPLLFKAKPLVVRTSKTMTARELTDAFDNNQLVVPSLQRGFVKAGISAATGRLTSTSKMETFIKDVFDSQVSKGYMIFFQNGTDPDQSLIIEGQQRVTSLSLFRNNVFAVVFTTEGGGQQKAYFKDLHIDDQERFLAEQFLVDHFVPTPYGETQPEAYYRMQVANFLACNDTATPLTESEINAARLSETARSYIMSIVTHADIRGALAPSIKDTRKDLTNFLIRLFVMASHRTKLGGDLGLQIDDALNSITSEETWVNMLVKMRQAIRLTYVNSMHQTWDGKFSKPLAEVAIVVFYIAFMRKLIDVNDINTHNTELKEEFITLIQDPAFRGYIKEGTNNPGTIDAENEHGERKGRYPLMIDMLCRVFTLSSSDFY